MVITAFRKSTDKLTSFCTVPFRTVANAKNGIELDASFFCSKHPGTIDLGWIKPKTLDYYCVQMKNGTMCYWQYFKV